MTPPSWTFWAFSMLILLSFQTSPHKITPICVSTSVPCAKRCCNYSPISSLMVVSFYSKIYSHFQINFPQLIFLSILPHPLYRPPFRNRFFPWRLLRVTELFCLAGTLLEYSPVLPSYSYLTHHPLSNSRSPPLVWISRTLLFLIALYGEPPCLILILFFLIWPLMALGISLSNLNDLSTPLLSPLCLSALLLWSDTMATATLLKETIQLELAEIPVSKI